MQNIQFFFPSLSKRIHKILDANETLSPSLTHQPSINPKDAQAHMCLKLSHHHATAKQLCHSNANISSPKKNSSNFDGAEHLNSQFILGKVAR